MKHLFWAWALFKRGWTTLRDRLLQCSIKFKSGVAFRQIACPDRKFDSDSNDLYQVLLTTMVQKYCHLIILENYGENENQSIRVLIVRWILLKPYSVMDLQSQEYSRLKKLPQALFPGMISSNEKME